MVEMLVVMAILGIAATFLFPALDKVLSRSKLQGSARETATLLRLARSEAIKRSVPAGVTQDINGDDLGIAKVVVAFVDSGAADPGRYVPDPNGNGITEADEDKELGRYNAPKGVEMAGPGDFEAGDTVSASAGFPEIGADHEGTAIFRPNGSAAIAGAFRFRDSKGNILEARVEPAATGRVAVTKYTLDPTIPPPSPEGPTDWRAANQSPGWEWY